MKGKKFLVLSLTLAMLAGSVLNVSAAGVADVFDANYYASKYSDVKAAIGTDAKALMKHFVTTGAKEGRVMNPILDVVAYRNAYADLDAAFGDNWDAYVDHYLTTGIKEKRITGVLFDLVDYANKNADVKAAYGEDYVSIAQQYINHGSKEGRPGGTIAKAPAKAPAAASSSGSTTTTPPASTAKPDVKPEEKPADEPVVTYTHVHQKSEATGRELPETCTEDGYKEWKCLEPLKRNEYDADGNWTGVVFVTTADGQQVFCDAIWRERIPASHLAPDSDDNYYDIHATCATWGRYAYTCTRCGEQIKEDIAPLEPVYVEVKGSRVASLDCKVAGYYIKRCENCNGTVHKDVKVDLPTLPHKLSDDKDKVNVTKEPTCKELGAAYGYCSVCAQKVDVVLDFAPHKETTVDAYANSYMQDDANAGNARTHMKYTVTYCTVCNLVTDVVLPTGVDKCDDGNGDGACDECGLGIKRNPTQQILIYNEKDTWHGNVQ